MEIFIYPKGVDKRISDTKIKLKKGLIEMLSEREISTLNIKEVCTYCKVNRTTFYNHYTTVEEVFDEIIDDIWSAIIRSAREVFAGAPTGYGATHWKFSEDFFEEIFKLAESNIEVFKIVLGPNGNIRLGYNYSQMVDRYIVNDSDTHELRMCILYAAAGIATLIGEWVMSDNRMPATEIAQAVSNLQFKGLDTALELMQGAKKVFNI